MIELLKKLEMDESLVNALEKQGITTPTEIQTKVIPQAIKNKDLIVQSETGTGKTLAYLLPLFKKIKPLGREMQAIILVPTHELAIQIQRQIESLSANSEVKLTSTPIIGDVNIQRQIEKLREKPDIIVGSPGRILELIKKKKISAHTIKTIIIDEADRLLDDNNIETVKEVIKTTLKERQIMLFSASILKKTEVIAKEIMKEPEFIKGQTGIAVPETIEHMYFVVEQRDKIEALGKLIRIFNPTKAIVFLNKSDEIDVFTEKIKYQGFNAESISGANVKLDRKKTMEDFKTGKVNILIASDIAARGMDIEGVTHIFNITIPEDAKDYLHRVGRTGRKGNSGVAVSIITIKELPLINMYKKILKIAIAEKDMYKGCIIDKKPYKKKI